jgi:glycerol-3-phosphate dehydrogenase
MVPQTADGRVLFAVPWHDKVIVGTTDTPISEPSLEPSAQEDEIEFILSHAAKYLTKVPQREDVLSMFAGLRPLVNPGSSLDTASIARDHFLVVSKSGLVTITGGKWTTYRKMGEEAIDHALLVAGLEERPCVTKNLRIHGWLKNIDPSDPLYVYGSEALSIKRLMEKNPGVSGRLHEALPYVRAEVIWAAREEMARTVEDVLARRTRALLLDARASVEAAPAVAEIMAAELGFSEQWQKEQVAAYTELASTYTLV